MTERTNEQTNKPSSCRTDWLELNLDIEGWNPPLVITVVVAERNLSDEENFNQTVINNNTVDQDGLWPPKGKVRWVVQPMTPLNLTHWTHRDTTDKSLITQCVQAPQTEIHIMIRMLILLISNTRLQWVSVAVYIGHNWLFINQASHRPMSANHTRLQIYWTKINQYAVCIRVITI